MWIQGGYFEHYFGKEPTFNIKFQHKPILAQKSIESSMCGIFYDKNTY